MEGDMCWICLCFWAPGVSCGFGGFFSLCGLWGVVGFCGSCDFLILFGFWLLWLFVLILPWLCWRGIIFYYSTVIWSCRFFVVCFIFCGFLTKTWQTANICKNYSIIITARERMVEVSNPTWPLLLLGVSYRSRATSAAQLGLALMIDVVRLVSWKSMEIREPRAGLVSHLEFCFTAIIWT